MFIFSAETAGQFRPCHNWDTVSELSTGDNSMHCHWTFNFEFGFSPASLGLEFHGLGLGFIQQTTLCLFHYVVATGETLPGVPTAMWHFFSLATSSANGSPPMNVWQRSWGREAPIEQMTCWIWTAISLVGASTSTYSQRRLIQATTLDLYCTTVPTGAFCMTILSSPMNLVPDLLAI